MAPRWPQVDIGPEHINEHATYLREACNDLQAVDKGRSNQIPWNIVQPYIASTLALIGKVLQQPSMREVLHQIQDAAKNIQNIQRDISVVKGTVGASTIPLSTANFSGHKAVTTWAHIAAQAKGLPPPPVAHRNTHGTKGPTTVTAYQDRVVTVKLRDHGIIQRHRNHSAAWTKQQVQAAIRDNSTTRSVKVVAAYQLKSGDIQIFTSSTAEAVQLKENKTWLHSLGESAELIVPTYGVIVHGVPTNSINIKDQKATIQQMLADNYTVIPKANISYIGWLTKEATLKRASSIVVEFTDPEMANAIIYAGMLWGGHVHQCQLYDRACRVKQCFRCYNYGHIGTQCSASQTCGYCAEQHETKHCKQKGLEEFVPRCTVCKGAHTAWSNACPARKKEMERVEQAKQIRSTYWHVPIKESTSQPRAANTRSTNITQEDRRPATHAPTQIAAQNLGEVTRLSAPGAAGVAREEQEVCLPIQTSLDRPAPLEATATQAPIVRSAEEVWATPATQGEPSEQPPSPPIDPQLGFSEEPVTLIQAQDEGHDNDPPAPSMA